MFWYAEDLNPKDWFCKEHVNCQPSNLVFFPHMPPEICCAKTCYTQEFRSKQNKYSSLHRSSTTIDNTIDDRQLTDIYSMIDNILIPKPFFIINKPTDT